MMGDLQIEDPCMHCLVTRRDRDRGLVVGDLQTKVACMAVDRELVSSRNGILS